MGGRMSSLAKMPFSEQVFIELVSSLNIHRSVIRAINRNTSCTFSRVTYPESIVYTCRTAESWPDDMALSVTFFPNTMETNAIWLGCDLEQRFIHGHKLTDSAIVTSKLREFDGQVFHPMMLPTIFAEFERDRHIGLISHLKNGLENWKTQLRKMVEHTKELEDSDFGIKCDVQTDAWIWRRDALRECGTRLRERLQDLMDEYDDFIRECDHIMAGMSLATQLDLNHIGRKDAKLNENISKSSLAVAETAQRDGSLMKSIAVLGMIYLPATFVCTFFSMGFFQWRGQTFVGISNLGIHLVD
ncbi:hypothetical protein A9Z42_0056540 [Trichoderma parareesei]|uniref:Uncharacterized protein n=1 Tax=Trichoderma parareesei TaxID=858221 RepID=A0A2H2ZYQ8_TRIPA|nr:hypothetical protein A9Z42_0056540 [Trichoderma parareesei]